MLEPREVHRPTAVSEQSVLKILLRQLAKTLLFGGGFLTLLVIVYYYLLQGTYQTGTWSTARGYRGCKLYAPQRSSGEIHFKGLYVFAGQFDVVSPRSPGKGEFSGPWEFTVTYSGWKGGVEAGRVRADLHFRLRGFEIEFDNGTCWVKQ